MYTEQVEKFADQAARKVARLKEQPSAIYLGGMLAGAYVGFGIILIMTLGTDVPPEFRKLVMGATFSVALVLVLLAGAELFTGYTMYLAFGVLQKRVNGLQVIKICIVLWVTNLIGACLLSLMYKLGGGDLLKHSDTVLHLVAHKKMNATAVQLFFNGILCNWLVCLALWISARTSNDTAKCIAIFWCLFAFISSGYEHSVANMTVFSLALLSPAVDGITLAGAAHNLFWVTFGNTVGGALFMGCGYWLMSDARPVRKTNTSAISLKNEPR